MSRRGPSPRTSRRRRTWRSRMPTRPSAGSRRASPRVTVARRRPRRCATGSGPRCRAGRNSRTTRSCSAAFTWPIPSSRRTGAATCSGATRSSPAPSPRISGSHRTTSSRAWPPRRRSRSSMSSTPTTTRRRPWPTDAASTSSTPNALAVLDQALLFVSAGIPRAADRARRRLTAAAQPKGRAGRARRRLGGRGGGRPVGGPPLRGRLLAGRRRWTARSTSGCGSAGSASNSGTCVKSSRSASSSARYRARRQWW